MLQHWPQVATPLILCQRFQQSYHECRNITGILTSWHLTAGDLTNYVPITTNMAILYLPQQTTENYVSNKSTSLYLVLAIHSNAITSLCKCITVGGENRRVGNGLYNTIHGKKLWGVGEGKFRAEYEQYLSCNIFSKLWYVLQILLTMNKYSN